MVEAAMELTERPIFVVGLPRSGSTLLENALTRDPKVLRLAEMLFLSPWRKDFRWFLKHYVGDIRMDDNLRRMIEIVFSTHGHIPGIDASFWRLRGLRGLDEPALKERIFSELKSSDRSLGSIFRTFIQQITDFNGYERCCVGFPVHVSQTDKLISWFPQCRILHISRDPRAIAVSKTNDPGGTAIYNQRYPRFRPIIRKVMMIFVVVQYRMAAKVHAKFRQHPNYRLVQYEGVLQAPAEKLAQVCQFVGLEFNADMLEQNEGLAQPSSISGRRRTGIDPSGATKWKSSISPLEEKVVTLLTRRSMAEFGL